ncbi:GFA family protein [Luteimonas aestuarii]|uniref:GFA family protein n=1 Tax=Luteimonas aestuarii TaxID=453837 RepID=A0A4V3ALN5_9GAMM|nr:GFA family protein [Luteimonas aestuarii]TDK23712.1 GFA family protein [Luteimonas aestuarii]
MPKHAGSCHCGQIAFEVEGDIDGALACNCSICARRASLLWFRPESAFVLRTPTSQMATYTFNRHAIKHHFCPRCGIHPYGEGTAPDGTRTIAINLRCIEGLDLDAIPVQHFDGKGL